MMYELYLNHLVKNMKLNAESICSRYLKGSASLWSCEKEIYIVMYDTARANSLTKDASFP